MAPKRKAVDPAQPGIAAALQRRSGEEAPSASPLQPFVRTRDGVTEMSDYAVNSILNATGTRVDETEAEEAEQGAPSRAPPAASSRALQSCASPRRCWTSCSGGRRTACRSARPSSARPLSRPHATARRTLCDRLLASLLRVRMPPNPACAAASAAALAALHSLHPPAVLEWASLEGQTVPVLALNPSAWTPLDSDSRRRGGGAAAASALASGGVVTRGGAHCDAGSDWDSFASLVAAAAAGAGGAPLGPEAAGRLFGARLALRHAARVLSDDAAARVAVFAGGARARAGARARELLRGALVARLYALASSSVYRSRLIENLVTLIDAGGCAADLPPPAAPPSQLAPESGPEAASTPPPKRPAAAGGGIGFTPSPLAKPPRMAAAEAAEAQLAACEGLGGAEEAAAAAALILSALLDVLSALEADGEFSAAVSSTRGGAGSRAELDEFVAACWLRGPGADAESHRAASLLATLSQGAHALRLARVCVGREAHVSFALGAPLRGLPSASPAADAAALFHYARAHGHDFVRGQRQNGGRTQAEALCVCAVLLAHAARGAAAADAAAPAAERSALLHGFREAVSALSKAEEAGPGGNRVDAAPMPLAGAAALEAAEAALAAWAA